jgi:integrase
VSDLPTKAAAQKAAADLRKTFNAHKDVEVRRTFEEVIARYEREEMPERYSTSRGYKNMHHNHINPKWGTTALDKLDALKVREWINGLECSTRSRGHIHGQMRLLCKFAMLWKWAPWPANPMSLFSIPGGTKRTRQPRTITPEQFQQLLAWSAGCYRFHAMLFGAYCLGLRASELFGLQWGDIAFLEGKVHIKRAIVDTHVGPVKTTRSEAAVPLPKFVADAFLVLYASSEFKKQTDWVFASAFKAGELPTNPHYVQHTILRKAGKAIGLDFNLGWHTFRHSFKNILKASGADPEMMRDMLRHSDTSVTMNVYGETDFERMRVASDKAMEMIFKR